MSEFDLTLRAAGLWPDPNPHTDAPPGGLVRADDVVIRRTGIVQPRPGLEDQDYGSEEASSRYIQALHPYDGDFLAATKASTDKLLNKDGDAIAFGGSDIAFDDHHVHSAAMRDVLYVPASAGLMRVVGADATTAALAGLPRAKSGLGTAVEGARDADEWLADAAGTVAYRCVLAVVASDDSIRLGPPSGRWQVSARTGGSNDSVVDHLIPVHSDWEGIEIRLYRSEVSGANAPSDEMALVMRHTISAAEASAGVVALTDATPAAERGESLYTNATQVGAEGEYRQPPTLGTVCAYRDMLFGGRVTGRSSIVLPFTIVPTNWFNNSGTGETVDTTDTSTTLANQSWPQSSDLYGLAITELGTNPQDADTYFAANTLVSYNGASWILSNAATSTDTAVDVELCEWIDVTPSDGTGIRVYFRGSASDEDVDLAELTVYTNDAGLGAALYSLDRVISNLAYVINRSEPTITAAHLGNGVLLIESLTVGEDMDIGLPRRLAANVGFDIAGNTATAEETSQADDKPHRLVWSALQVPEGFPPLQFLDLGSESHPIDALVPTRYGVYAFKYDGVWRIDGRTADGLSAERIGSARLCAPKCVAELNEECFAWTDQGLVRIGPGGIVDNLTDRQLDVWLGDIQKALPEESPPPLGAFLSIDRADGVLYLGVPATASDDVSEWVYTMDVKPAAWTRWSLAATDVANIDGRLYVATYEASTMTLRRARLSTDDYPHHDDSYSLTLDSVTVASGVASLVNVAVTGSTPVVGDWIVFRGPSPGGEGSPATYFGAVASYDAGTMTVRVAPSFTPGFGSELTGTLYQGPDCAIAWKAKASGSPHVKKLWSDVAIGFETLERFYRVAWEYRTDQLGTAAEHAWVRTPEIGRTRPEDWLGGFVPRNAARGAELLVLATLRNPGAKWALRSLQLRGLMTGTKTGIRGEVTA